MVIILFSVIPTTVSVPTRVGILLIVMVMFSWTSMTYYMRTATYREKARDYTAAAIVMGAGPARIIFSHILPNCMPPMIVIGTVQVAGAIALEATLSFLGIGLPITEPSLGLLIANGFEYLLSGKYWISFFPGIALLVTIISINLVGDQLRDILNPRLQR